MIENIGAGEGNRTLVFSLEVRRFPLLFQRPFIQIGLKRRIVSKRQFQPV